MIDDWPRRLSFNLTVRPVINQIALTPNDNLAPSCSGDPDQLLPNRTFESRPKAKGTLK
jgi:hypothetical protein